MRNSNVSNLKGSALLVTSSVYVHAEFTKIVNPEQRSSRVITSVLKFIQTYPNLQVVICDGSGFDFSTYFKDYSQVTTLFFKTDASEVNRRGKGYGEGEIVNYALENFFENNHTNLIVKVTGGVYVSNLDSIFAANRDFQCALKSNLDFANRQLRIHRVDTRVLVFRHEFFKAKLSQAHLEVNERGGKYLEDVYYDVIKLIGLDLSSILFVKAPKFFGYSGSTGLTYGNRNRNLVFYPLRQIKLVILRLALKYNLKCIYR